MENAFADIKEESFRWFIGVTYSGTIFIGKIFDKERLIHWRFLTDSAFADVNDTSGNYRYSNFIRDYKMYTVSEKYLILRGWI